MGLLLANPLTAQALRSRYKLRKGSGKFLVMLVLLRSVAPAISRRVNSTTNMCFAALGGCRTMTNEFWIAPPESFHNRALAQGAPQAVRSG
jgi:hypothetical protein